MDEKGRAGMDIRNKVIEIIAQQAVLEVSDITMDSTLESLGIESLGLVESIFAIEEAFDIQIPFNANEPTEGDFDISSVSSIIADIEKIMVQQSWSVLLLQALVQLIPSVKVFPRRWMRCARAPVVLVP